MAIQVSKELRSTVPNINRQETSRVRSSLAEIVRRASCDRGTARIFAGGESLRKTAR